MGPLERLFEVLSHAVEASSPVAVSAAFVWGILSVVLSPCNLASIPLVIGFVGQEGRTTTKRAAVLSSFFAGGILVSIAGVGAVTALAGRLLGDIGSTANYLVGAFLLLIGLILLDVISIPWSELGRINFHGKGPAAAFILGLVFGITVGPCTFGYMAPVLAVVFKVSTTDLYYGLLLLLVFGVGHCAVIVLAGTFTTAVQAYLGWSEKSKGTTILRRVCGVLVIVGALYLLYKAG